MTSFVVIPGACHGGWWYQPLVERLSEYGHVAHALTLAGLGDDETAIAAVNLDTHIAEATAATVEVAAYSRERLVLVGHSYGGSVVSGVADRVPDRISALVYLDAFVPDDGDSCFAMTNDEQRRWYIDGAGDTGFSVQPLPFFDVRAKPHPVATLLQRARLTGAWRSVPAKHSSPQPSGQGALPSRIPSSGCEPIPPGRFTRGRRDTTCSTTARSAFSTFSSPCSRHPRSPDHPHPLRSPARRC